MVKSSGDTVPHRKKSIFAVMPKFISVKTNKVVVMFGKGGG